MPDPRNDTVTFDTDSDNYCPQILDELSTSAELKSYQDAPMLLPQVGDRRAIDATSPLTRYRRLKQAQFVFGTTAYFEAVVTSAVVLENVHVVVRSSFSAPSAP